MRFDDFVIKLFGLTIAVVLMSAIFIILTFIFKIAMELFG